MCSLLPPYCVDQALSRVPFSRFILQVRHNPTGAHLKMNIFERKRCSCDRGNSPRAVPLSQSLDRTAPCRISVAIQRSVTGLARSIGAYRIRYWAYRSGYEYVQLSAIVFCAIDFRSECYLLDWFLPSWPYLNRYARHLVSDKSSDPAQVDALSENPVFSRVSPTLDDDSRAALLTGSTFAQSRDNNRHRRSA